MPKIRHRRLGVLTACCLLLPLLLGAPVIQEKETTAEFVLPPMERSFLQRSDFVCIGRIVKLQPAPKGHSGFGGVAWQPVVYEVQEVLKGHPFGVLGEITVHQIVAGSRLLDTRRSALDPETFRAGRRVILGFTIAGDPFSSGEEKPPEIRLVNPDDRMAFFDHDATTAERLKRILGR